MTGWSEEGEDDDQVPPPGTRREGEMEGGHVGGAHRGNHRHFMTEIVKKMKYF